MSFTNSIYESIYKDLNERNDPFSGIASRLITMSNGIRMVYSVNVSSRLREAYVELDKKPDKPNFPKWHGTHIDVAQLPAYGDELFYIRLSQLPQSEGYIFEIVVEDLRSSIEALGSVEKSLSKTISILQKWKKFFQTERDIVLSEELQEGLYGELLFLERSIKKRNTSDVRCWAGGNRETHDFYYTQNAVEVKSSSRKEPYSAIISSEYQLDSADIPGRLFLYYIALRKSKSSGERLPEIIGRLRNELETDYSMRIQFDDKLRQYGYLDEAAEEYVVGFEVRDDYFFEVTDAFPRIIRTMYQTGVARVSYELMISQCMPYQCGEDNVFFALEKGGTDA